MKYYILDWTMNWADEMDIYSAEVVTNEELSLYQQWLEEAKEDIQDLEEFELYIGTNESIKLTYDDLKNILDTAVNITKIEYDSFNTLFESSIFGNISFENIKEQVVNQIKNCLI